MNVNKGRRLEALLEDENYEATMREDTPMTDLELKNLELELDGVPEFMKL